ncbi:hypothetical protein CLOP_g19406 [Closterium sp. NIES-67]|nr:hypothetical protein CLOP_g19406 [Closterium sp. NIES-67]
MRSSARISDSHFALPRRPHYHSDARTVDTGFEGGLSRRMLFKSPPSSGDGSASRFVHLRDSSAVQVTSHAFSPRSLGSSLPVRERAEPTCLFPHCIRV